MTPPPRRQHLPTAVWDGHLSCPGPPSTAASSPPYLFALALPFFSLGLLPWFSSPTTGYSRSPGPGGLPRHSPERLCCPLPPGSPTRFPIWELLAGQIGFAHLRAPSAPLRTGPLHTFRASALARFIARVVAECMWPMPALAGVSVGMGCGTKRIESPWFPRARGPWREAGHFFFPRGRSEHAVLEGAEMYRSNHEPVRRVQSDKGRGSLPARRGTRGRNQKKGGGQGAGAGQSGRGQWASRGPPRSGAGESDPGD